MRLDRISGEYVLLSPERGLILNGPAGLILQLCTGSNTLAMIVDHLTKLHPGCPRARLVEDLSVFLHELEGRGLIHEAGS
ncbi:MAG TPA: pyrroloquinoline quinone biosynthesis peptide chaperone PqqD [Nitrospiraceae bacterium]|nr:pyrroloquinoline quinone biosynthesis peptide chaperone PqqD [Nitrospiraceae bacterium]